MRDAKCMEGSEELRLTSTSCSSSSSSSMESSSFQQKSISVSIITYASGSKPLVVEDWTRSERQAEKFCSRRSDERATGETQDQEQEMQLLLNSSSRRAPTLDSHDVNPESLVSRLSAREKGLLSFSRAPASARGHTGCMKKSRRTNPFPGLGSRSYRGMVQMCIMIPC